MSIIDARYRKEDGNHQPYVPLRETRIIKDERNFEETERDVVARLWGAIKRDEDEIIKAGGPAARVVEDARK